MSSDLEERLRDARSALGSPGPEITDAARGVALSASPARRLLRRRGAAAGFLTIVALGLGLGSLTLAGPGEASKTHGLAFAPLAGWVAFQSGTPSLPDRPGVTLAANVPLDPADTRDGLPYSTLRGLPKNGVVLIASFFRVPDEQGTATSRPLQLDDARPYIRFGGPVRPRRPLGQYEMRAVVDGFAVDVHAYFGTSTPSAKLWAEAQRQLDRLIAWPAEQPAATRTAARADAVTLSFQRYWYPPGNYFTMRFFGTISSGQAGEYVAVMKKECGTSFSTAIAGTLTTAGGGWEATPDRPPGGGEFRAKWNDELSEPMSYKLPMQPWLERVGQGKLRATVTSSIPPGAKPVGMAGRRIDLQRLVAGQWVRMRTAKLVRLKKPSLDNFYRTFVARFTVRRKGLRLRAYAPAETAAPCFAAGASKAITS